MNQKHAKAIRRAAVSAARENFNAIWNLLTGLPVRKRVRVAWRLIIRAESPV